MISKFQHLSIIRSYWYDTLIPRRRRRRRKQNGVTYYHLQIYFNTCEVSVVIDMLSEFHAAAAAAAK